MEDRRRGRTDPCEALLGRVRAASGERERHLLAVHRAGVQHLAVVEELAVGVVERGRLLEEPPALRKPGILDLPEREVMDARLVAEHDSPDELQREEINREKRVPLSLVPPAVLVRPGGIPGGTAVEDRERSEERRLAVVERLVHGHGLVRLPPALLRALGVLAKADHVVDVLDVLLVRLLGREQKSGILPADPAEEVPEAVRHRPSSARGVSVRRVPARAKAEASDLVHVESVESAVRQFRRELREVVLELRRFAAHVPQAVLREDVVAVGQERAAPLLVARALEPAIGRPAGIVAVPRGAVRVDLREDASLLHPRDRRPERGLALARRPEEGIVRVIRDLVPPVPVHGGRQPRLVLEALGRTDDALRRAALPHPERDVAQPRAVLRPVGAGPRLGPSPRAVDPRRLVPSTVEPPDRAAIRQRERAVGAGRHDGQVTGDQAHGHRLASVLGDEPARVSARAPLVEVQAARRSVAGRNEAKGDRLRRDDLRSGGERLPGGMLQDAQRLRIDDARLVRPGRVDHGKVDRLDVQALGLVPLVAERPGPAALLRLELGDGGEARAAHGMAAPGHHGPAAPPLDGPRLDVVRRHGDGLPPRTRQAEAEANLRASEVNAAVRLAGAQARGAERDRGGAQDGASKRLLRAHGQDVSTAFHAA